MIDHISLYRALRLRFPGMWVSVLTGATTHPNGVEMVEDYNVLIYDRPASQGGRVKWRGSGDNVQECLGNLREVGE